MSAMKTIDLGDHFGAFVDAQVEAGNFASADEVIRAGLSLLEREDADEEARIRAAIEEGLASGDPLPFELDDFLHRMHLRVGNGDR
ncbi:type II toxin-antitoxin system ParD family antitoxin [Jiella endophytica]|uniref:Type II toxin-antitoxin system ParD family antitoxin n=1 Tax=Jiella endophytica TaxID=2558362 RepID=A0A4Y8RD53_9HYPH|nr:type II toxin-antitoxin system ParD family antitoxin [Jiella endophytica]TFF19170.1 type II toxin-antitoxin system ParD family antitoxin [Jiella endophytica]